MSSSSIVENYPRICGMDLIQGEERLVDNPVPQPAVNSCRAWLRNLRATGPILGTVDKSLYCHGPGICPEALHAEPCGEYQV